MEKKVKEVSVIAEFEINFENMIQKIAGCTKLNIPNDFVESVQNFEKKFCQLRERLINEGKISLTKKLDNCLGNE